MASDKRMGSTTPIWLREPPDSAALREVRDALCRMSGRDPGRPPSAQEALDLGVAMSAAPSRADADRGRNWLWVSAASGSPLAASELARHITETGPSTPSAPSPLEMMALVGRWLRRATAPAPQQGASPRSTYDMVDPAIFAGFEDDDAPPESPANGTVVVPYIGDALSKEGREIQKRYGHFVGVALPTLGELPNPAELESEFIEKFPWEPGLARWLKGQVALQRQAGRQGVVLPHLLLVGPSGSGKTTMLEWLVRKCKIPCQTIPVGGTNDAAGLAGVARGWLTAQPSMVTLMMADNGCANPCIILDELDKGVEMASRNGSVVGTLLALLQPPADGWRDPYLMAPVDLSQVTFMGSANDMRLMPTMLRSRMTVRPVSAPGPEHFDTLLPGVIEHAAAKLSLSSEMMPWFSGLDREWMRSMYVASGCNIRHLEQAYGVLIGDRAADEEMAMRRPH
jgi:hypothetical protein